jgi:hypothetical protein
MIEKAGLAEILLKALRIKKKQYYKWPVHVVAQAGFVFRKAGEIMFTAQDIKYKINTPEEEAQLHKKLELLAYENIAVTLRFLERLKAKTILIDVSAIPPASSPEEILDLFSQQEIMVLTPSGGPIQVNSFEDHFISSGALDDQSEPHEPINHQPHDQTLLQHDQINRE